MHRHARTTMAGLDAAGLALAGVDSLIKIFVGLKRRRDASKQIPQMADAGEKRVRKIRKSVSRYTESVSFDVTPREVFVRVVNDFDDILHALTVNQQYENKGASRRAMSAETTAQCLVDVLSCLSALEKHLDLYGLMAHAESTRAAQFQKAAKELQNASATNESNVIIDLIHDLMSQLQISPRVSVLGRRLSSGETVHSPNVISVDPGEDISLKACVSLKASARELLEKLDASDVPLKTKHALSAKIQALWDGWQIDLYALTFARNKIGDRILLGEGVSSSVYKAFLKGYSSKRVDDSDEDLDPTSLRVAVKELRTQRWKLKRRFPSLLREVFLQLDMDHACILKTFGAFYLDGVE